MNAQPDAAGIEFLPFRQIPEGTLRIQTALEGDGGMEQEGAVPSSASRTQEQVSCSGDGAVDGQGRTFLKQSPGDISPLTRDIRVSKTRSASPTAAMPFLTPSVLFLPWRWKLLPFFTVRESTEAFRSKSKRVASFPVNQAFAPFSTVFRTFSFPEGIVVVHFLSHCRAAWRLNGGPCRSRGN